MPLELTPKQPPYYEIVDTPTTTGPKEYIALLTQIGTADPTALVQKNTFSTGITWTRTGVGEYTGTLTGAFTLNKTTILVNNHEDGINIVRATDNTVTIQTWNDWTTLALADSCIVDTTIHITVYPI